MNAGLCKLGLLTNYDVYIVVLRLSCDTVQDKGVPSQGVPSGEVEGEDQAMGETHPGGRELNTKSSWWKDRPRRSDELILSLCDTSISAEEDDDERIVTPAPTTDFVSKTTSLLCDPSFDPKSSIRLGPVLHLRCERAGGPTLPNQDVEFLTSTPFYPVIPSVLGPEEVEIDIDRLIALGEYFKTFSASALFPGILDRQITSLDTTSRQPLIIKLAYLRDPPHQQELQLPPGMQVIHAAETECRILYGPLVRYRGFSGCGGRRMGIGVCCCWRRLIGSPWIRVGSCLRSKRESFSRLLRVPRNRSAGHSDPLRPFGNACGPGHSVSVILGHRTASYVHRFPIRS